MNYNNLFGLIAEGPSDHSVLKNILIGLLGKDIFDEITELQPNFGESNDDSLKRFGGWYKVFQYCRTDDFKKAFVDVQYVVIQIDTDVSEHLHYDIKQTDNLGVKLLPEILIEKIREKFILIIAETFGISFLETIKDRIIFAISVDEIECWLLPIYYNDKVRQAIHNCDYRLHQKAGKFEKNADDYDKISKEYRKSKIIQKAYPENPSLKIFVESVLAKNIIP